MMDDLFPCVVIQFVRTVPLGRLLANNEYSTTTKRRNTKDRWSSWKLSSLLACSSPVVVMDDEPPISSWRTAAARQAHSCDGSTYGLLSYLPLREDDEHNHDEVVNGVHDPQLTKVNQ